MSSKYRIKERDREFKIQQRIALFWWSDLVVSMGWRTELVRFPSRASAEAWILGMESIERVKAGSRA